MSYASLCFGCRVNQADSAAIDGRLSAAGLARAEPSTASLVVINTCAVTAGAEQSARQAIRRIARVNPGARIVVTGCYATRAPEKLRQLPGVAEVWANEAKDRSLSTVRMPVMPPPGAQGRTVAFLRVQTGCDQRCAYCLIPTTRGHQRSLAPEQVLATVGAAARAGYREVVLAGVHLGGYGTDLSPACSLFDLVRRIDRLEADLRVRLSSIEPMDCGRDLVGRLANARRVVPHLHLPLQHGSDAVLARMRRPYVMEDWLGIVRHARELMPGAAIGTDLIAGFPGETEREFAATLDAVRQAPLSYVHVFPYSDRPGTAAASMPGKVAREIVRRRVAALRRVSEDLRRGFAVAQVGQVRDAITLQDPSIALTDNYLKVRIPPGRRPNERVTVRIDAAEPLAGAVVTS